MSVFHEIFQYFHYLRTFTKRITSPFNFFFNITGVRALLIDKDQNPKWNPSTLENVTHEIVQGHFNEMPGGLNQELRNKL